MERIIKFRQPLFEENGGFMRFHYWGVDKEKIFTAPVGNLNDHEKKQGSQQFTGCIDKNGKEIYEGDLIQQFITVEPYPVFFKNGTFMLMSEPLCYDFGVRDDIEESMLYETYHWAVVVGNIYENADLIKP